MLTISRIFEDRIEEKKSTFISALVPINEFDTLLSMLKKQHPKARHFVTASRELNELDQIIESFSDDGEPKGTSGMPTLKVLAGNNLINTGIITIRYFGGTLLGTGGLVRAYSDVANKVISTAELEPYIKLKKSVISIPFSLSSKAEYLASNHNIAIIDREFYQDGIRLHIEASAENIELFSSSLTSKMGIWLH
ncbi:MAG: YigZ family protein [Campylobacterales bacterium]